MGRSSASASRQAAWPVVAGTYRWRMGSVWTGRGWDVVARVGADSALLALALFMLPDRPAGAVARVGVEAVGLAGRGLKVPVAHGVCEDWPVVGT